MFSDILPYPGNFTLAIRRIGPTWRVMTDSNTKLIQDATEALNLCRGGVAYPGDIQDARKAVMAITATGYAEEKRQRVLRHLERLPMRIPREEKEHCASEAISLLGRLFE